MERYYDDEYDCEDRIRDLRIIWRCISCGYEYEDYPGYNEAVPCPKCGRPTMKAGESYALD